MKRAQRQSKGGEVIRRPLVADVEVVRERWRALKTSGQAADHDEAHAVFEQHAQDAGRVKLHHQAPTERRFRATPIAARTRAPAAAFVRRSSGLACKRSRMRLRSTPSPSRGSTSRSKPQARSSR